MRIIHLVYPHGPGIAAPDAIGRNLGSRLERCYCVRYYDCDASCSIHPGPDDVLLGHPHPLPWTCFRRSMHNPGWRRVLAICPYAHGKIWQVAFEDAVVRRCDLHLAITGNYWFSTVRESVFSHWLPKMIHLDLAVDRHDFPVLRASSSPPGKRGFVYIGHSGREKDTAYLSRIARHMRHGRISWIGRGPSIRGLEPLGYQDFSTAEGRAAVASHDFLVTVGRSDANPTTILEAMAWGLIPVCTPQSGYVGYRGVVNIPLDDPRGAVAALEWLQNVGEAELTAMREANWGLLDEHFNWDRFSRQVIQAIESEASPPVLPTSLARRARIVVATHLSPYSVLRPNNLARFVLRRGLAVISKLR